VLLHSIRSRRSLTDHFDAYRQKHLQEKIFVHTDKEIYVPGEILWFRVYNVEGYLHTRLDLEKCVYVELLDRNNRAVLQAKIGMEKGLGEGSFILPASIVSGDYTFRAYTNWMKNFAPDYFFHKRIRLINPQKNSEEDPRNIEQALHIDFFPEGGNLLNGIMTKIGFKITDQFGRGVDGQGVLINEKGDTVTTFRAFKFGIGNFSFTPVAGSSYMAVIRAAGKEQVKAMPAALNSGYSLHLEKTGKGQIRVSVHSSRETPSQGQVVPFCDITRN
jgi:hypothetical protein